MFLIMLWSLLLTLFVATPAPAANYRKIAAKDMKYSVLLHMRGHRFNRKGKKEGLRAGCSGTYIAPRQILTAAHCFEGYDVDQVWARGPDDVLGYPVHVLLKDKDADLALVETVYPHVYAKIGRSPRVGDEIMNIGSPMGFEFVASQGIVSVTGMSVLPFSGEYIVSTAFIDHGSSGGGMFDRKGQLIGVNTLSTGFFGWGGLSLAVDTFTIKRFLADAQ